MNPELVPWTKLVAVAERVHEAGTAFLGAVEDRMNAEDNFELFGEIADFDQELADLRGALDDVRQAEAAALAALNGGRA